jgi:CRP/FNR family transcriptional regulator, nitrogen fixation regulation protein
MKTLISSCMERSCSANSAPVVDRKEPQRSLDSLAVIATCHRGKQICSQGAAADHWHRVVSGVARGYVSRSDGRRKIVDLLLPGDFFGFTVGNEYDCAVEAVAEGTVIASYSRRRVEMRAESDPRLAREICQVTFKALSRLQAQILIVGRITALEKVGSFILEMATRLSNGRSDNITLPVSRYDIADYLTVSVETVSRSLTDLKQRGIIELSGTRMIRILDPEALEGTERR